MEMKTSRHGIIIYKEGYIFQFIFFQKRIYSIVKMSSKKEYGSRQWLPDKLYFRTPSYEVWGL